MAKQITKMNKQSRGRLARPNQNARSRDNIPDFKPDRVLQYKVRLSSQGGGITFSAELPFYPFGIAKTTTSLIMPFESCRLRKIEMWKTYVTGGTTAANTIGLKAIGIDGILPVEMLSTAGPDRNAHLSYIPSPNRTDSWWYPDSSGTNPTYTFTLPDAAILEYTVDFIINDENSYLVGTSSGLVADRTYYNCLGNPLYIQAQGHFASADLAV
jgi:hypothetical protein